MPRVARDLSRIPEPDRRRIEQAMDNLAEDPRPVPHSKQLQGEAYLRRRRVGDYRIIYRVDDAALDVTVLAVLHRQGAYK